MKVQPNGLVKVRLTGARGAHKKGDVIEVDPRRASKMLEFDLAEDPALAGKRKRATKKGKE